MKKIALKFVLFGVMLFSINMYANKKDNIIYFQSNNMAVNSTSKLNSISNLTNPQSKINEKMQGELNSINTIKISEFINKIRKSMCGYVKNGSIKVWLVLGFTGKVGVSIVAVSANANSGLEVVINCKNS